MKAIVLLIFTAFVLQLLSNVLVESATFVVWLIFDVLDPWYFHLD